MGEGETVPVLLKEDGTPYKTAVLIPTINNADELDIVLERLGKQTYPHFELIIADSKSKDHTKAVCCLLYTSPSPRDLSTSRMPSSA